MAEGAAKEPRNRRLFQDVSAVQVIATALAAVTSMLLSSYIGIAGSIIGVAVASIVSTLAASLYKKFLADSAEKIKEIPVVGTHGKTLGAVLAGGEEHPVDSDATQALPANDAPSGATAPVEPAASAASTAALAASAPEDAEGRLPEPGAQASAEEPEDVAAMAAQARHQRHLVRGLIVVCILSALLAVAASGAVVYFATTGQGLGAKPASILVSAPVSTSSSSMSAASATSSSSLQASSGSSSDEGSASSASASAPSSSEEGPGSASEGGSEEPGSSSEGGETDPAPTDPDGEGEATDDATG